MAQTIFFLDKYITFSDSPIENYDLTIDSRADDIAQISRAKVVDFFEKYNSILFLCNTPDDAYKNFCSEFRQVEAAGGVVRNCAGDTLMIFRNGRWDLPKGHLELGESLEQCAIREVEEETSIAGITLGEKITQTQHTYTLDEQWVIKTTHWWQMSTTHTQTQPQSEEGIERVEWCTDEQVATNMENTYPTIRTVINLC